MTVVLYTHLWDSSGVDPCVSVHFIIFLVFVENNGSSVLYRTLQKSA